MSALPTPPAVSAADISADVQFFSDHPWRDFRISDRWVVRRRHGGVFLRTPRPPGQRFVDTERNAEFAWWSLAWPALSPLERAAMAKAARGNRRRPNILVGERTS